MAAADTPGTPAPGSLDAWSQQHEAEKEQVRRLGGVIGYGNMITLARELWAELLTPSLGEETARHHTKSWGCEADE